MNPQKRKRDGMFLTVGFLSRKDFLGFYLWFCFFLCSIGDSLKRELHTLYTHFIYTHTLTHTSHTSGNFHKTSFFYTLFLLFFLLLPLTSLFSPSLHPQHKKQAFLLLFFFFFFAIFAVCSCVRACRGRGGRESIVESCVGW
ncbi:hypothetical protein QBC44DRAFT_122293 [Cladorrhinum sp. PSN332]|nr:hypothetical protein QBC44DRAFT_122293 [Cladorrhinum sp. PSN332]